MNSINERDIKEINLKRQKWQNRKNVLKAFETDLLESRDNYVQTSMKQSDNIDCLLSYKKCRTAKKVVKSIKKYMDKHVKEVEVNNYERLLNNITAEIQKCDAKKEESY